MRRHPLSIHGASSSARLDQLYRDHMRELCRYVQKRFGSGPPEPEELAQAAFAKLAAAPDLEAIGNPRSYLFTIASNLALDHYRRASHHDAVHRDMAATADTDSLSDFSPERVLLAKERMAVFEAAVAQMPALRRRMFLLARVEGHSPAELARRFGVSESAVRKHVMRALADCAAAFAKWDKKTGGNP